MLLLRYRTRKIVFRSMVVLYFFAAIWLLLFANGYRFRLNPFTISRTGNILATFVPKKALVTIDGEVVGTSSPTRIRALFPGVHDIKISADGFIPYERSIRIEPQETSFVSDVYLVRDTSPQRISVSSVAPTSTPENVIARVADKSILITTSAADGTRLSVDGTTASRDLGIGGWKIVGGDTNLLALARTDTGEIQFRNWNNLDTTVATLPGRMVVPHEFNGVRHLLSLSTFELWNLNSDRKTAELVYRFSKPIIQVIPVPETTLIIVQLADEIVAFHLGDPHYIPTVITNGAPVLDARISSDAITLQYTVQETEGFVTYKKLLD